MQLYTFARGVLRRSSRNQATLLAAGVSFYFFLSLIPALVAAVSIFGLFLKPSALESLSRQLGDVLPADAASLVVGQLNQLAAAGTPSLGFGAAIALVVAIWGASSGISNLLKAVNFMYESGDQRSFVAGRALGLALTLGAGFLLAIVIGVLSIRAWLPFFDAHPAVEVIVLNLLRWLILLSTLAAALTVIFKVAPKGQTGGKAMWIGVGFATVACVVTTAGFSFYVSSFASYQATYGALAGVIVLLLWLWIAIWSVLVGACVHAEFQDDLSQKADA